MHLGIIGGGQLARMLALAAHPLEIQVLCYSEFENCPAADVCPVTTNFAEFLERVTVITFETENIADALIEQCEASTLPCYPPTNALRIAQDRGLEKKLCNENNCPTAVYWHDKDFETGDLQFPGFLKTCRGGYDGRGQAYVQNRHDLLTASLSITAKPQLFETKVDFLLECSIIAARGINGETCYYPLTKNKHVNGILHRSETPFADEGLQNKAEKIIQILLEKLNYVGVLAIELFLNKDGEFIVNEMAPRVHNSGHWTQNGAATSQFENHVRAVCGLPLGETRGLGFSGMINVLSTPAPVAKVLEIPGAFYHGYHKTPFANRKIGHVNVLAQTENEMAQKLATVQELLDPSRAHLGAFTESK